MLFRRKISMRMVLALLILLLAGGGGVGWWLQARPEVQAVSPAPGSRALSSFAPLRITFSRPMLADSAATHLQVTPPVEGAIVWEENTLVFTPALPWPSGGTIEVTMEGGARTPFRRALGQPFSWSFTIAQTSLAYLWPSTGPANIFALDPATGETTQLTEEPLGVLDFSLHTDGRTLYFSAATSLNTGAIRMIDLGTREVSTLWTCETGLCQDVRPSPDGRLLAYLHPLDSVAGSPPQIRLLVLEDKTVTGGVTVGASSEATQYPAWSSGGILSVFSVSTQNYLFYTPSTGNIPRTPSQTGEAGSWQPGAQVFVFPEILDPGASDLVQDALPTSHLMRYNAVNGLLTGLGHAPNAEDASPAFSPDGAWLVFGRKFLDDVRWTPGRQLWRMTAEGKTPVQLTNAPLYDHTAFTWHPDSTQLAYLRTNKTNPQDPPELWLINADGTEPIRLVIGGFNPVWIP